MADAKSATRGRRHDSNFAKVLAGPHYWISVKTKSGRVVRIPIAGKSRRAAGKGKARKATVRPFGGTQGRDVQYRAKGQGGAAPAGRTKIDRSARVAELRKAREKEGLIARRTFKLSSEEGSRTFDYRHRVLSDSEQYAMRQKYGTSGEYMGRHVVEERITDNIEGKGKRIYEDWRPKSFGPTKEKAIREGWDSNFERARPLSDSFKKARETVKANQRTRNRVSQLNATIRGTETMLLGGPRSYLSDTQSLKSRYNAKYEAALKKAKLHKAAQSNSADPAKIKAIAGPIQAEYQRKVEQAKRVMDKAKRRAARLSKRLED